MKHGLLKYCLVAALFASVSFVGTGWADDEPNGDPSEGLGVPGGLYEGAFDDDVTGDPAAADDGGDVTGGEQPSYKNAAQAHHAANLQQQALLNDTELNEEADKVAEAESKQEEANKELQQALTEKESYSAELEEAQKNLNDAQDAYDADPANQELAGLLQAANAAYNDALNAYNGAVTECEQLENAYQNAMQEAETAQEQYAEMLGERTGVLAEEIADMRQVQKMGWGEIAHFLGVEPKYLGRRLGHLKNWKSQTGIEDSVVEDDLDPDAPLSLDQELAEVTRRNVKTGWSNSHGMKSKSANSAKDGVGLSKSSGKAAADAKGNKGGNSGKSDASSPGNSGKSNNGQKSGVSSQSSNNNSSSNNKGGNSSSSSNKGGNSNNSNDNKGGNSSNSNGNKGGNSSNNGNGNSGGNSGKGGGNSGNNGGGNKK